MSRSNQLTMIAIACVLALGCNRPTDRSDRPDQPHKFLGIPEDETSNEGPVGLIGGQAIRVSNVSKVRVVPFSEYKRAIDDSRVVAEEQLNGFVYWAVKEERDVPFENATAWVTVLERYKSRIE